MRLWEGEFVKARCAIENEKAIGGAIPFRLELAVPKSWREAEVHVLAESGCRLNESLVSAGLYKSAITKFGTLFEIHTAQGEATFITEIYSRLIEHCRTRAAKPCSVKLEMLIRLFKSEGFNWCAPQAVGYLRTEQR